MILPLEARPLLEALCPVFTAPTFARFVTLFGSAILCTGRRTVANLLRTAAPLTQGHRTTYQRVLSSAEWSALQLACQLARLFPHAGGALAVEKLPGSLHKILFYALAPAA